MSGIILSVQNGFVRTARTLKDKKGRTQQGAFLVEGVKCVGELLVHQPSLLRTLIITEDAGGEWAARAKSLGRRAVTVAPHVMAAICETKMPQAVAAVAALPEPVEIGWVYRGAGRRGPGQRGDHHPNGGRSRLRRRGAVGRQRNSYAPSGGAGFHGQPVPSARAAYALKPYLASCGSRLNRLRRSWLNGFYLDAENLPGNRQRSAGHFPEILC